MESSAKCNAAQLVVDNSGDVIVPIYDWCSFFAPIFKKMPDVNKTQNFRMSVTHPGKVFMKADTTSLKEDEHKILKAGMEVYTDELPPIVNPKVSRLSGIGTSSRR